MKEIKIPPPDPNKCACGAPWGHTGKHWPELSTPNPSKTIDTDRARE